MSSRSKRRPLSAILAISALATISMGARAEEETPPRWEPGEPTTSALPEEVRGDRYAGLGSDGVYGRFDGTFDVGLAAGAELDEDGALGAARASAHYFFMAGVYAAYADALGGSGPSARNLGFGVDLRPAFIPRWSEGLQQGPSLVDLALDSIALGLGAYFREPRNGSLGDRRGLELSLGMGIPIAAAAAGPWLGARWLLRWEDPDGGTSPPPRHLGLFTVEWHWTTGG